MTKDIANRIGFSTEPTPGVNGKADGVWDLYDLAYFKEKNIWPTDSSSYVQPTGSLRFFGSSQGGDEQKGHLLRVFDNYGDSTKWTFSTWLNANSKGSNNSLYIFGVGVGQTNSDVESIYINGLDNGTLIFDSEGFRPGSTGSPVGDSYSIECYGNGLMYKDWNHLVVSFDSTVAISTDRLKFWINGIQVPTKIGAATTIPQNFRSKINTKSLHIIGGQLKLGGLNNKTNDITYYQNLMDGYLSDIHFIDGQFLQPSNFGEFNSFGVWSPKAYSSDNRDDPYGKNGFRLNFSDTTSLTINRLGKDSSSNNNNWQAKHKISIGTTSLINSNGLTGASNFGDGAFSNVSNNNNYSEATNNGGTIIWNPDKSITAYESIRIWIEDNTAGTAVSVAKLNEVDLIPTGPYLLDQAFETLGQNRFGFSFPGPYPVGITSLKLQRTGNNKIRLYNVEVDGVNVVTDSAWRNRVEGVYYKTNQTVNSPYESSSDTTDNGLGGEIISNYCRLSPWITNSSSNVTDGNLRYIAQDSTNNFIFGTMAVSSGKWYWEVEWINNAGTNVYAGIATPAPTGPTSIINVSNYTEAPTNSTQGFIGLTTNNISNGDEILGFTLDFDALQFKVYKNNVLFKTESIVAGPDYAPYFGENYAPANSRTQFLVNFGSVPFNYQAPSGFKCLCSANLPTPRVGIGNTLFDVITYDGTGSQQSLSSLNFKPDLVWIKSLSSTTPFAIYDSVRGPQRRVGPSTNFSEIRDTDGLISFDNTGFTVGVGTTTNFNGGRFAALCWNVGGGSTVVNTSGVITSYVKSNPTCGVGIITYVGTGVTSTVGHGLTTAPSLIFIKNRTDNLTDWAVYYPTNDNIGYLTLNKGDSGQNSNTYWGINPPTSSVFSVGISSLVNQVNKSYVAYAFANSPEFMRIGAYRVNSTSNQAFVWTGFKPRFVLIKNQGTASTNWVVHCSDYIDTGDQQNSEKNGGRLVLNTNVFDTNNNLEITSNGFKVGGTPNPGTYSGNRIIYIAISELAYKYGR